VVVVARHAIFILEPRDEDGDLVCYQDHWYRKVGPGMAHALSDSPSLRARRNVARVRSDVGTGGFINVPIEAVVVLTRARPEDVRSSRAGGRRPAGPRGTRSRPAPTPAPSDLRRSRPPSVVTSRSSLELAIAERAQRSVSRTVRIGPLAHVDLSA
jgi:hypothetical protein